MGESAVTGQGSEVRSRGGNLKPEKGKGSKQETTEITEEDEGSSQNTGNGMSQKLTKITKIINHG